MLITKDWNLTIYFVFSDTDLMFAQHNATFFEQLWKQHQQSQVPSKELDHQQSLLWSRSHEIFRGKQHKLFEVTWNRCKTVFVIKHPTLLCFHFIIDSYEFMKCIPPNSHHMIVPVPVNYPWRISVYARYQNMIRYNNGRIQCMFLALTEIQRLTWQNTCTTFLIFSV